MAKGKEGDGKGEGKGGGKKREGRGGREGREGRKAKNDLHPTLFLGPVQGGFAPPPLTPLPLDPAGGSAPRPPL